MATQSRILIWIIPRTDEPVGLKEVHGGRKELGHGLATEHSTAHGPQYLKENRKRDLQENCPDLVLTQWQSNQLLPSYSHSIPYLFSVGSFVFFSTTYTYHTSLLALFGLKLHLPPSSSHWQR